MLVVRGDDAPVSFEEAFVDGDQRVPVVSVVKDEGGAAVQKGRVGDGEFDKRGHIHVGVAENR